MTTYSLNGFTISRNSAGDIQDVDTATVAIAHPDGTAEVSYSVLTGTYGPFPAVDITSQIYSGSMSGGTNWSQLRDADTYIGEVEWGTGQTAIVIGFVNNSSGAEFVFQLDGDPLPSITTPAEYAAFETGLVYAGVVRSGPFAPGETIDLTTLYDVGITEVDDIEGTEFADTLRGGLDMDFIYGYEGNDLIEGQEGNDHILTGGAGDDTVRGGVGADMVAGNDGNDLVEGGEGNDLVFDWGNGDDTLRGDAGDDLIESDGGTDIVDGGTGFDTLSFGQFNNSLTLSLDQQGTPISFGTWGTLTVSGFEALEGTFQFGDQLSGTTGNDELLGSGGNDTLIGDNGNDTLYGGLDDDSLRGGAGADSLLGGDGIDNLDGGYGNDTIDGGLGNDLVYGNLGDDSLFGGDGDDNISDSAGYDTLDGGAGNDTLDGGDLDDLVMGGAGDDRLTGEVGTDTLLGGDGNDFIISGRPGSVVMGEAGNDTMLGGGFGDVFDGGAGGDHFDGNGGIDTVSYESATRSVRVDLQNDAFMYNDAVGDTFANIEVFQTGRTVDQLRGDASGNEFYTGGLSDRLYGRAGDDMLFGETGADALYGGTGADTMTGGDDAGRRDRYIYFNMVESGVGSGNRDVVTDFVAGEDRIEISRFDADLTQGFKQHFSFVGDTAFSGAAGELRFEQTGGNTIVQADVTGDGLADFEIELTGLMALTAGDFLI